MVCLKIYWGLLSLANFLRVHSNSEEVSSLSWQKSYPNLKITCHIKLNFLLWTKLLENLTLAKYLISVAVPLRKALLEPPLIMSSLNVWFIAIWCRTFQKFEWNILLQFPNYCAKTGKIKSQPNLIPTTSGISPLLSENDTVPWMQVTQKNNEYKLPEKADDLFTFT